MSAYVKVDLQFRDEGCLVTALEEMGYTVERHPNGAVARAYQGDDRFGHVFVRRGTHADTQWEDMAFERQKDGTFAGHLSSHLPPARINQLRQTYAKTVAIKTAKAKGYAVHEQKAENGRIKLTLRRYA